MDKYAIVIAGPSGAGKTTVAESLIDALGDLEMSRSATTRQRRGDGKDDEYVYLTVDEFKASIKKGDVLEYTEYSGNYYGTRKCELDRILAMGKKPILVLDYYGVRSLKERLDYPVFAVYVYTTLKEASNRLKSRDLSSGSDDKKIATYEKRMAANVNDYLHLSEFTDLFDLYIENNDLDNCVKKIARSLSKAISGEAVMSPCEKEAIVLSFEREARLSLS